MHARYLICCLLLGAQAAPAVVPVGSIALYSDGRVEKLMANEAGRLHWEDDRKRRFVRATNPIVPPLERTDFLSQRGYRQNTASGDPDAIHRLPAGSPVEFSVIRTRNSGEISKRYWECVYLGKSRQQVLETERDLDRYTCERFVIHRKLHNRSFREKREFSYSPDLGLVVDLQRQTRKNSSSSRLVRVIPPDKADYRTISRAVRKLRGK